MIPINIKLVFWEMLTFLSFTFLTLPTFGQEAPKELSQAWIKEHLVSDKPRIIFTKEVEQQFRAKLASDDQVSALFQSIKQYSDKVLSLPPVKRKKQGRRLLSVSREAMKRTLCLAMVYRIEQAPQYLQRLEEELIAVCNFSDWNPDHFLDVAEMAVALSLPLDWLADELSPSTKKMIHKALVDKAFKPSIGINHKRTWWWNSEHNWNLVCHGGLAIAALAIYEEEPDLASHILNRSYQQLSLGLKPYYPDGAYNEGPSYWFYATNYLTLTLSAFESSLGTGFDFLNTKGVKESALFTEVTAGPSGDYFNYFDASLKGYRSISHIGLLAWFSARVGTNYLAQTRGTVPKSSKAKVAIDRFAPLHAISLTKMPDKLPDVKLPQTWLASGNSPLGVFRPNDENGLYLAAKGGSAFDNHGNMDAGSFIIEWKKIRWALDLGNQNYSALEETIGSSALWGRGQDSQRWTLLTKNNSGHNTLSINEAPHLVKGRALVSISDLENKTPSFAFDLSSLFGKNVDSAIRTFQKMSDQKISIKDDIQVNENTKLIRWQLLTTAKVDIQKEGVLLTQDEKSLFLQINSTQKHETKVVSLDPPPLDYDKQIDQLKRIEFIIKPDLSKGSTLQISVDIIGM